MRTGSLLTRFALPKLFITAYAYARYRAFISPRAEVEIGRNLALGTGSVVGSFSKVKSSSGRLMIGERTMIATNCFLAAGAGGLHIGKHVLVDPNVSIVAVNYKYDRLDVPFLDQGQTSKGIQIGDNVWLGAGSVVLDGADVGSGAIVTPNSTVSGRVPPNTIVQGNPAAVVFTRR
jgi:acetyltransferase-like isoleucine patch superfamily enzyme